MSLFFCNFAAQNKCITHYVMSKSMKKQLIMCLMALLLVCLAGCQSNAPQVKKQTIDLEVKKNKWSFDEKMGFYYCQFDVPELTSTVYNYGEVSVSREYNSGTRDAYQTALPETKYLVENEVDEKDSIINTFYYQQHIDYIYGVGFVEVDLTISDYFYGDFSPESMIFRLQLTY